MSGSFRESGFFSVSFRRSEQRRPTRTQGIFAMVTNGIGRFGGGLKLVALLGVLCSPMFGGGLLGASPAWAQDVEEQAGDMDFELNGTAPEPIEDAPAKRIYGSLELNFTSEYYFFGLPQENQGLIFQPTFSGGITVLDNNNVPNMYDGFALDVYAGNFNSLHFDNPSTEANDGAANDSVFFFEGDLFVGFTLGLPAGFSLDVSYWNVYGPSGGVQFDDEIDITIGYDDSALWEEMGLAGFALNPSLGFVVEIDGGADALGDAGEPGTLLLLGIAPSYSIPVQENFAVDLSVPVTVGIELENYYENAGPDGVIDGQTVGEFGSETSDDEVDDSFGYLEVGLQASAPLSPILPPEEWGAWTVGAGVNFILLGDAAEQIGQEFGVIGDDSFHTYVNFTVSVEF